MHKHTDKKFYKNTDNTLALECTVCASEEPGSAILYTYNSGELKPGNVEITEPEYETSALALRAAFENAVVTYNAAKIAEKESCITALEGLGLTEQVARNIVYG